MQYCAVNRKLDTSGQSQMAATQHQVITGKQISLLPYCSKTEQVMPREALSEMHRKSEELSRIPEEEYWVVTMTVYIIW